MNHFFCSDSSLCLPTVGTSDDLFVVFLSDTFLLALDWGFTSVEVADYVSQKQKNQVDPAFDSQPKI
jgi:hypothetical protein